MLKLTNIPTWKKGDLQKKFNNRLTNINFIKNLDRCDLAYITNEVRLQILTYPNNELLAIQYPGKESKDNPFDFRPKLSVNSIDIKDLSFGDIWSCLFQYLDSIEDSSDKQTAFQLLCCEFYRIAFMIDYDCITDTTYLVESRPTSEVTEHTSTDCFYKYTPNKDIIVELNKLGTLPFNFSWEAFFHYNELLVLNEDCKYYTLQFKEIYTSTGNQVEAEQKAKKYLNKGTGRANTMRTHMSVLNTYINGGLGSLLDKFSRGRGVAPMNYTDMKLIIAPLLT